MDNMELDFEMDKDIINLLDEEGNEHEFEIIDAVEHQDHQYLALIPVFEEADESLDDSGELVILRVSDEQDDSGEEFLEAIEDEDEYNTVANLFMDRLDEEYDFEDEE